MSNFNAEGEIYGVIWSFGKPPCLTEAEIKKLAFSNWNFDLYASEKGRAIAIRHLRNLHAEFIFLLELSAQELMQRSKSAKPATYDKKMPQSDMVYRR